MKVQFIFPNYDCPIGISIGVSYLSAILKERGYETKIIHICDMIGYPYNEQKIIDDIKSYAPDLIAISTGENHYRDMTHLSIELKKNISTPIAIGGVHATINAEEVANSNNGYDYILLGEGEEALPELVEAIEKGRSTKNIPNVWAKIDGYIYKNKMRPLVQNLSLPFMDLEGWEFEKITLMRRGWVNVSMNRGCPYRCSFCHNLAEVEVLKENFKTKGTGNKELGYLRLRNIENMIQELKYIKLKYPFVKEFSFIDDTFTYDKTHMMKFFELYATEVNLPFVCLTTINDLDEELIRAMKKANCDMIRFGVETATSRIRKKIINRNFSISKIHNIFRLCKENNIRTFSYNIIAHPSEQIEEIEDTLKLNASLMPEGIRISLGYPYKGTRYYEIAKEMNLLDEEKEYYNYSTFTKFKFTFDEKLWIDKCRVFFKWWLNMYLENECSVYYKKNIDMLLGLSSEEWNNEVVRKKLLQLDWKLSEKFKQDKVVHYTSPYEDRPDIVVLYDEKVMLEREAIDEH